MYDDTVTGLMNETVDSRIPLESYPYHRDGRDNLFPAWLIGVIVLSSVAFIILVVTIVQRYLQKRQDMRNNLHMMERW
ncbi:hypothetical protein ACF0H5_005334 [Mactra antiquata]